MKRALPPLLLLAALLGLWQAGVRLAETPVYILPAPSDVALSLIADWPSLWPSLLVTLEVTGLALLFAIVGGGGLAVLFSLSRTLERAIYPLAVVLQVTPVIGIAPLILIYAPSQTAGVVLIAWIVAFFPVLANTTLGLRSVDPNLVDLFRLYGAGRGQELLRLRLPAASPYFFGGLRIAGGLALIGAVVAEFVAGSVGAGTGLAFRILEASYRLQTAKMFAGLVLLALSGVVIFVALNLLGHLALRRWHESALVVER